MYALNRIKEELSCGVKKAIPAKVFVVRARGGLACTLWMSTCMVGESHCAQSGVAHRPRMKARNAAILIGAGPNTAANSPRSLGELEA